MKKAIDEEQGFIIRGLSIESAEFDAGDRMIKMATKLSSPLPTVILKWLRKDAQPTLSAAEQANSFVDLPVYLNRSRKNLLCSVTVPTGGVPAHTWYQRGVALFAAGDEC